MKHPLLIYGTILLTAIAAVLGILFIGGAFSGIAMQSVVSSPEVPMSSFSLELFLIQILVIVGVAKIVGMIFHRLGQPRVIGEMCAGLCLGPSLFGLVAPEAMAAVFPDESMTTLRLLSQFAIVLYMFLVGMDLDISHFREKTHQAFVISHVSIAVPFVLGCALALFVREPGPGFAPYALFLGIALSITAFPVLARILEEKGLLQTRLGSMAISCAAVDDATAWCLLAVVVAVAGNGAFGGPLLTLSSAVVFVLLMLFVIRPLLAKVLAPWSHGRPATNGAAVGVLLMVFASALATERIGIHALFGAFLAGVIMPECRQLRAFLKHRVETVGASFLLPLFFVITGLRTHLGLLNSAADWLLCAVVIALAIVGKLVAAAVAARLTGTPWPDALALGVLMNTRGLMELIVLNLGLEMGILDEKMFTIFVIMALVTTIMTGPLLGWIVKRFSRLVPSSSGFQ